MTGKKKPEKYWVGQPDPNCDICDRPIDKAFVDGRTRFGPWGNMCMACFRADGAGLGLGLGQKYEQQADGRWLKTGG